MEPADNDLRQIVAAIDDQRVDSPGDSAKARATPPGDASAATSAPQHPWPVPRRTLARRLARWSLILLTLPVALSVLLVAGLRWVDPPASAFMLQHAWNLQQLGQSRPYYRHRWLPWTDLPETIRLAAIAGEDQRFPTHLGFDLVEIRSAWSHYRSGGRLRGASTITQQTAKNLFLWPGSGWDRKLLEAWFTLLMEILWPKQRILEVYLNIAQFSPGTYGIEATATTFFGHSARDLTPREAALLIGVLPAPGRYRLDKPNAELERRTAWIQDQTQRLGGSRYLERLSGR